MHPADAICHANGGNSFLASPESAVRLSYMWRGEMKRLDLPLHLSLTFCHKYAVCQISYARKEGEKNKSTNEPCHSYCTGLQHQEQRCPVLERAECQQTPNHTSGLNWETGKVDINDIYNFCSFFEELRLFLILLAFQTSPTVHCFVQPQSIKSNAGKDERDTANVFRLACLQIYCKVTFWSKMLEFCRLSVVPGGPAFS